MTDWAPTIADLSALLRTRVLERVGAQATQGYPGYVDGTETELFTATTRPTASQVQAIIDMSTPLIAVIVGAACPEPLVTLAKQAAAFRAAATVEASFFPRQTGKDQTANDYYDRMATAALASLQVAADRIGVGDQPGPQDGSGGLMSGAFPPSPLSVVGPYGYPIPRAL